MTLDTPINAKIQTISALVEDKKTFDTILNIIKYYTDNIISITMSRATATAIDCRYFAAIPNSIDNTVNDNIEISNQVITFNDFEPAGDIIILYERRFAYFDDDIRRKIKRYTNAKNLR